MGEHAFVVDPFGQTAGQLAAFSRRHEDLAAAFLVEYRNPKTREGHQTGLRFWFAWCDRLGFDPLAVARHHVQLWMQELDAAGKGPRTRNQRLTTLRLFYRYLLDEELIEKDPTARIKSAPTPRVSSTQVLRDGQMLDLVQAAKVLGPHPYALCCVLNFNGLRIGELCSRDVTDLIYRQDWPHLHVVRGKTGHHQWLELDRLTEGALKGAIGDRTEGPLLLTRTGTRMNRAAAARVLRRLRPHIRNAPDRIHPHMLRHSWTTSGIRAGVSRQRMIEEGGWTSGRMMDEVYEHIIDSPGRGASHMIAASVMSG